MPSGSEHNIDDARRALAALPRELPQFMRQVAMFANARIGHTATTRYMHDTGKGLGRASRETLATVPPNTTDKLRRLTGNLSRSVTMSGFTSFGPGRPSPPGRARQGFVKLSMEPGPRLRMEKGTNVVYAYIHEFGGTITIPVTTKARGFFWAMWYETGDDMWKAMALSKKSVFKINMRARPYLGPALTDEAPRIQDYADAQFSIWLERHLRRFLP